MEIAEIKFVVKELEQIQKTYLNIRDSNNGLKKIRIRIDEDTIKLKCPLQITKELIIMFMQEEEDHKEEINNRKEDKKSKEKIITSGLKMSHIPKLIFEGKSTDNIAFGIVSLNPPC